ARVVLLGDGVGERDFLDLGRAGDPQDRDGLAVGRQRAHRDRGGVLVAQRYPGVAHRRLHGGRGRVDLVGLAVHQEGHVPHREDREVAAGAADRRARVDRHEAGALDPDAQLLHRAADGGRVYPHVLGGAVDRHVYRTTVLDRDRGVVRQRGGRRGGDQVVAAGGDAVRAQRGAHGGGEGVDLARRAVHRDPDRLLEGHVR